MRPMRDPEGEANRLYGPRHIGRSWSDTHIEDVCPCGKAPCGLVDSTKISPLCADHPVARSKTMRRIHKAEECPPLSASGVRDELDPDAHSVSVPANHPSSRRMKSMLLPKGQIIELLDTFLEMDQFQDEEQKMSFVELMMEMALHVGRNPLNYVPCMNRYLVSHDFVPHSAMNSFCHYCERTFLQGAHTARDEEAAF